MTANKSAPIKGIFPPVPTPFHEDGSLACEHLQANLRAMNAMPLDGYVIQGSNGEYVYLSIAERVAAIEAARAVMPAGRLLIAGSGMEGTAETIALTRQMAAAGADIAIVVSPCYYKAAMTSAALERHYLMVADAAPIPVMLYNVPGFTGVDMGAEVAIRCAAHTNICGIKDSSANVQKIGQIVEETRADFSVLTGSGGAFLGALAVGAAGTVAALANVAAAPLAEMQRLFLAGKLDAAAQLQRRLIPVNMLLTARLGIAGLKAALALQGLYGGQVRAPLLPLPEVEHANVRAILQKAGLLP